MINNQNLKKIEKIINYKFTNINLLKECFQHSSLLKKNNLKKNPNSANNFERLEFLGDRVLGLSIAYLIYKKFPNYSEGKMSLKFSYLVQKNFLSKISNDLDLYKFIQISKDKKINIKYNKSILSDTLESVIGAIFIDGGYQKSIKFVEHFWGKYILDEKLNINDPKTVLQELSQQKSKLLPKYKLINKKGPSHSPIFRVSVSCLGKDNVFGMGKTIREAERLAAEKFLNKYKKMYEK